MTDSFSEQRVGLGSPADVLPKAPVVQVLPFAPLNVMDCLASRPLHPAGDKSKGA